MSRWGSDPRDRAEEVLSKMYKEFNMNKRRKVSGKRDVEIEIKDWFKFSEELRGMLREHNRREMKMNKKQKQVDILVVVIAAFAAFGVFLYIIGAV